MLSNLIKILKTASEFDGVQSLCEGVTSEDNCIGLSCHDCPFYSNESLSRTIDDLEKAQEKQDV